MSGTSADRINVALVRITELIRRRRSQGSDSDNVRLKLLGHAEYAYPRSVRQAVLSAMNAGSARVADLARLNFLLGELYADAVKATQRKVRHRAQLIGCHGQTLYHQGEAG